MEEWYEKNYLSRETPDFVEWFHKDYGPKTDYEMNDHNESDEYYTRRAFALRGWLGARKRYGI